MPATFEVKCANENCELGTSGLHYTYDMPDDVAVANLSCPYYSEFRALREIQL